MEQLEARRAHNPKAGGSSPSPAIKDVLSFESVFFYVQELLACDWDLKRSERGDSRRAAKEGGGSERRRPVRSGHDVRDWRKRFKSGCWL